MFSNSRYAVLFASTAVLVVAAVGPVFAIFPKLQTALSGAAIDGVVPTGEAKVDQSGLPQRPGTLEVRVDKVNLPNGTVLGVVLTDCGTAVVGTITLSGGRGALRTSLPQGCQVGRQSSILVNNGNTTILRGGAPWKV